MAAGFAAFTSAFAAGVATDYPEPSALAGLYKFTCADYTLLDNDYAGELAGAEFEFWLTYNESADNFTVTDFLREGESATAVYDRQTGVMTFNKVYFTIYGRGKTTYLYIVPDEGGYTGMTAATANFLKFEVQSADELTIEDFTLGTLTAGSYSPDAATFSGCSAVRQEIVEEEPVDFAGTYPFEGKKYFYENGGRAAPTSVEDYSFDLVINADNQIVSIAGYTLPQEEIVVNRRNEGKAKGNTLTFEASFTFGVSWEQVDMGDDYTFTESWLIGGPETADYNQLSKENKVVFTLNEDGTYSLTPFTMWYRHQILVDGEGAEGTQNKMTVMDLQYKWEGEMVPQDVNSVIAPEINDAAPVRYYNLQGVEIAGPQSGLYIMVQGTKATKVLR